MCAVPETKDHICAQKDMPFEFFCVQLYFVLCVYCNRSRLGVFKNGVLTEYLDLRGIK